MGAGEGAHSDGGPPGAHGAIWMRTSSALGTTHPPTSHLLNPPSQAASTTIENLRSLEELQEREVARAAKDALAVLASGRGHAFPPGTPMLRRHSKRGVADTLTFTEVDEFPAIIAPRRAEEPPKPRRCVVTGKPARYFDPLTRAPYADAAAFAVLRARHAAAAAAAGGAPPEGEER